MFKEKLESTKFNAWVDLTRAIRVKSEEKFHQELGLKSLRDRRWCRKLCLFYKVLENLNPKYLFSLITARSSLYSTRNIHNIPLLITKHNIFKYYFFPSTIIEWNNLDHCFRKSESFSFFKTSIFKFVHNCHNSTRLRIGISHSIEHTI